MISLVIESVVFPGLQDAEEEKAGESEAPDYDEQGGDDVAGMGFGGGAH